jgi:uncharacterized membrane protein
VKYTAEAGLLGPTARVVGAFLFGIGLLVAGEWMRPRVARLAHGLSAAGVSTLFVALLAAVHLYHLIPEVAGFFGMLVLTIFAVLLSLRQGPIIALVGLVGGYMAPLLIGVLDSHPAPLFSYLLLLEIGLVAVTRLKRWAHLASLTMVASLLWSVGWLMFAYDPSHGIWLALFLLASVAAFMVAAIGTTREQAGQGTPASLARVWLYAAASLLVLGALVGVARFEAMEWVYLGVLSAGCLVLARIDKRYEGLAWLASGTIASLLLGWGLMLGVSPDRAGQFVTCTLALGGLLSGGAFLSIRKSEVAGRWAALSFINTLAFLAIGYVGIVEIAAYADLWGLLCIAVAVLYVGGAFALGGSQPSNERDSALTTVLTAIAILVGSAAALDLDPAAITIAWAVEIPILAWLSTRLELPRLRLIVGAAAALVLVRLLLNPFVLGYPLGEHLLLNWITPTYGITCLAFVLGGIALRRAKTDISSLHLDWGAIGIGIGGLTLWVRQAFNPGSITEPPSVMEWSALTSLWLVTGAALLIAGARYKREHVVMAGSIAAFGSAGLIGLVFGVSHNPMWYRVEVGNIPYINLLLLWYGVPALITGWLAVVCRRRELRRHALFFAVASLGITFMLLSLETRQLFHGSILVGQTSGSLETLSYSGVWVLYGTALLVLGIRRSSNVLRYASLAVMLLAVAKVFLFDTGDLDGLMRVAALMGLGASLLLLSYLYQRFVFDPKKPA